MKPQVNDLEKYEKFFKGLHRDEHKCLVEGCDSRVLCFHHYDCHKRLGRQ